MKRRKRKPNYKIDAILFLICIILILMIGYIFGMFFKLKSIADGMYIPDNGNFTCNKINGTMEEDGYCLLTNSGCNKYVSDVECSWLKIRTRNCQYTEINIFETVLSRLYGCGSYKYYIED